MAVGAVVVDKLVEVVAVVGGRVVAKKNLNFFFKKSLINTLCLPVAVAEQRFHIDRHVVLVLAD